MADGEVMQLESSSDISISQEKYFEIIFGKTAVLFSCACEAAALINNKSDKKFLLYVSLVKFGNNFPNC